MTTAKYKSKAEAGVLLWDVGCPHCQAGTPVRIDPARGQADVWTATMVCPECRAIYAIEIRCLRQIPGLGIDVKSSSSV